MKDASDFMHAIEKWRKNEKSIREQAEEGLREYRRARLWGALLKDDAEPKPELTGEEAVANLKRLLAKD